MNTAKYTAYYPSPAGLIQLEANTSGITGLIFCSEQHSNILGNEHTQTAIQQLSEYFAGTRRQFELPLCLNGTVFQKQVWTELTQIEYGDTATYSDIASAINRPAAVRAVGAANGRNPISIIVPCHRVIGKNGHLTGYAWGTKIKAKLLALEQQHLPLTK